MLPDADADVDIDELIDDDEDEDVADEEEIDAEDQTTDEDEQRPTTSSSSPTPLDDDVLVADTAAAAAAADSDAVVAPLDSTSPSDEDDAAKDETESRTDISELQSNEQQSHDDVTPAADTGRSTDDLPETSVTADEEDADADVSQQADVEETEDREETPGDTKCMNGLAEKQQETFYDADDKVQITDAPEEVCQSTAAEAVESCDVIPAKSSTEDQEESPEGTARVNSLAENQQVTFYDADDNVQVTDTPEQVCQPSAAEAVEAGDVIPAKSLTSSLPEQLPQTEFLATRQQDLHRPPANEDKGEQSDITCSAEMKEQTLTEQHDRITAADQTEPNDLEETSRSEMGVESDREPDSPATDTKNDQSIRATEKREQTVQSEREVDSEGRSSSSTGDEVTSQEDGEGGCAEVREESKVTEEVKVTYEASAKQLDLLSRLAMLRERAAQRKAQQTPDGTSTQEDSRETSSGGDGEPPRPSDDSAGRPAQSTSPRHPQSDDVTHAMKDKQPDEQIITSVDAGTAQEHEDVTRSSSHATMATANKSHSQLVTETNEDRITESPSDGSVAATAEEQPSSSTVDNPTTENLAESELPKPSPTADILGAQLNTTDGDSDNVTSSTEDLNMKSESICSVSNRANTDVLQKLLDDRTTTAETDPVMQVSSTDRGSDQPALTDLPFETVEGTAAKVLNDQSPQPVHSGSVNICATSADHTGAGRLTDSRPATADVHPALSAEPSETTPDTAVGELSNATSLTETSGVEANESTHLAKDDDVTVNYDSDLDPECAGTDAVPLLADIHALKSNTADGPGHLYAFIDRPRERFKIGASRSPAKRLRQAAAFNPDITSLICLPVRRRLAALGELRLRLAGNDPRDVIAACLSGSRDWFTASDDVITELVGQVAAAETEQLTS